MPEIMRSGATFSSCKTYRYSLWRIWDEEKTPVVFIGLNPSTADEMKDDPTIRRCMGFARRWGYGGIYMVNLFAYRATSPRDLFAFKADPIGHNNDATLHHYTGMPCVLVVAAWGNHGTFLGRGLEVAQALKVSMHCFGYTKAGQPLHPLYQRSDAELQCYKLGPLWPKGAS